MGNVTTFAVFASYASFNKGPLLGHVRQYADGRYRYFPEGRKPSKARFTSFDECLFRSLPRHYRGVDGTMSERVNEVTS